MRLAPKQGVGSVAFLHFTFFEHFTFSEVFSNLISQNDTVQSLRFLFITKENNTKYVLPEVCKRVAVN